MRACLLRSGARILSQARRHRGPRRFRHRARDQPDLRRADRLVVRGGLAADGRACGIHVVELGPGAGPCCAMLRAARVCPPSSRRSGATLVESNDAPAQIQRETLAEAGVADRWHARCPPRRRPRSWSPTSFWTRCPSSSSSATRPLAPALRRPRSDGNFTFVQGQAVRRVRARAAPRRTRRRRHRGALRALCRGRRPLHGAGGGRWPRSSSTTATPRARPGDTLQAVAAHRYNRPARRAGRLARTCRCTGSSSPALATALHDAGLASDGPAAQGESARRAVA